MLGDDSKMALIDSRMQYKFVIFEEYSFGKLISQCAEMH